MKRQLSIIAFLVCVSFHSSAETVEQPILDVDKEYSLPKEDNPPTLSELKNFKETKSEDVTDLRSQMLSEAGYTVGFRGGMAAQSVIIIDKLNERHNELNNMFQFGPLVNKKGVLPPVIVEADNLASFSPGQIRTANKVYRIERAERFVSIAPSWRDYLYIGLRTKSTDTLPAATRPKNSKEKSIWNKGIESGWVAGKEQANNIIEANFNRLIRDYTGIIRYSTLLQQGLISKTTVTESRKTVTGSKNQLILGDKLRRVSQSAEFETDPGKWKPTITSGTKIK